MIYYFSATGNSEWVARRLAEALGDEYVSIDDCLGMNELGYQVSPGESIGFICPVYFWGLPKIMETFLERFCLRGSSYIYFVATYGTTTGQAAAFMEKCLKKKHLSLSASFAVKMPDVWTPMFDLSDREKVQAQVDAAEPQIDSIIGAVRKRLAGDFISDKVPMAFAAPYYATYPLQSRTSRFTVDPDRCIGCGLCARKCPSRAIKMVDKHPEWVKKNCTLCLGCLHRCPKFAIQFGKKTAAHGQYQHKKYVAAGE